MKTMPESDIIPVLTYPNIDNAIIWLSNTLGFKERWRIGNHRAQVSYGNCTIAITEGQLGNAVELMIKIKGIDEHYSKCQLAGIAIIAPPTDHFYGERQYTIKDIGGHFWTLSETIKDLLPEDWGATSNHNG